MSDPIDYKKIVEDIATIMHGGVWDIPLLSITVKNMADRLTTLRNVPADLYLCPVTRSGEKLFSPCGRDYPRGRGYYTRPAPPAASQPSREQLRNLVDMVWNTATESTEVPSTKWADELIDRVFSGVAAIQPYTVPDVAKERTIFIKSEE